MPEISPSLFKCLFLMPHQPEEALQAAVACLLQQTQSVPFIVHRSRLLSLFVTGFVISYMQDDFSQGK